MASILDEKCGEKDKAVLNRRNPFFSIPPYKSLSIYITNFYPTLHIVFALLYAYYKLSVIHTRGYQKVLSLTWKEPEIWIYSALFFNVVPFQLHTLVPSSYPVINTRSVEVNILVP